MLLIYILPLNMGRNHKFRFLLASALGLALCTSMASAETKFTDCQRAGVKRSVEVVLNPGDGTIRCQVFYDKKDEGAWKKKKLWQANYEYDFCFRKASELLTQLKAWGWDCKERLP